MVYLRVLFFLSLLQLTQSCSIEDTDPGGSGDGPVYMGEQLKLNSYTYSFSDSLGQPVSISRQVFFDYDDDYNVVSIRSANTIGEITSVINFLRDGPDILEITRTHTLSTITGEKRLDTIHFNGEILFNTNFFDTDKTRFVEMQNRKIIRAFDVSGTNDTTGLTCYTYDSNDLLIQRDRHCDLENISHVDYPVKIKNPFRDLVEVSLFGFITNFQFGAMSSSACLPDNWSFGFDLDWSVDDQNRPTRIRYVADADKKNVTLQLKYVN